MIGTYATEARGGIMAHVVETSPIVQQRIAATEGGLISRGMDAVSAHQTALASLYGTVLRQSMVLSFDRIFMLSGFLFLLVLSLTLFLKPPKPGTARAEIHLE